MGLGRNSRKIFAFKGLKGKIFRNKNLASETALKTVLGEGHTSGLLPVVSIVANVRLGVCDGDHRRL
jgi:hypothetical protein